MSVAGVAWATFICQSISCLLSQFVVILRLRKIKSKKAVIFDFKILKQISAIAVPSILQQSFISTGNIIIQSVINSYGAGVIAGYAESVKLNNLVITSFTTLGNGISNYTAQNIGAKKYERITTGVKAGIRLVWCLTVPLCTIYLIFSTSLLKFFLEKPSADALHSGVLYLRILAPFYFIIAAKLIADGVLRGAGLMKQFMIATLTDLTLRVLIALILSNTALGYTGIWCAWPIGWSVAAVLSIIFLHRSIKNMNA